MPRRAPLFALVLSSLVAGALALLCPPTTPAHGQAGAKYIGPEKCKMCHEAEHTSYMEMTHSKAWSILKPEDIAGRKDLKDRPCIQCHSTGYGRPTGFVSTQETPHLVNVSCESCHGPGGNHMTLVMQSAMLEGDAQKEALEKAKGAISRNTGCVECHDPHISHKKLYGEKKGE